MNIEEAKAIVEDISEWVKFDKFDNVCLDGVYTLQHLEAIILVAKEKKCN